MKKLMCIVLLSMLSGLSFASSGLQIIQTGDSPYNILKNIFETAAPVALKELPLGDSEEAKKYTCAYAIFEETPLSEVRMGSNRVPVRIEVTGPKNKELSYMELGPTAVALDAGQYEFWEHHFAYQQMKVISRIPIIQAFMTGTGGDFPGWRVKVRELSGMLFIMETSENSEINYGYCWKL